MPAWLVEKMSAGAFVAGAGARLAKRLYALYATFGARMDGEDSQRVSRPTIKQCNCVS